MGCNSSADASGPRGKPIVTITGISGYIGANVALKYLEDGGFRVRGTVRDKDNQDKLAQYQTAFGKHFSKLELVNADLLNEQSIMDAIAGSTYVVHVASPFFYGDDEEALVKPAVEGTMSVMNACKAHKVKRCVVTSSCLSVFMVSEASRPADGVFTEAHWSEENRPEGVDHYTKSKILAERAAWKFVEDLPAEEKFELVCVLPSFVMGPPLLPCVGTSVGLVQGLMTGGMKEIPSNHVPSCDVRQVADAHVMAVKNKSAAGKRFMIVQGNPSLAEYAEPICKKYRGEGWPITEQIQAVDESEFVPKFDNSASKELGIKKYNDFNQTMLDMAAKMITMNMVTKEPAAQ